MQQFWAFQNLHFVWLHKFQMAWSFRVLRLLLRLSFDVGCCSFFTLGNSCDKNNGDCEYLCLSILQKQRCFCKEGMKLKENGKNCEKYKLQGKSCLWPVHWISIVFIALIPHVFTLQLLPSLFSGWRFFPPPLLKRYLVYYILADLENKVRHLWWPNFLQPNPTLCLSPQQTSAPPRRALGHAMQRFSASFLSKKWLDIKGQIVREGKSSHKCVKGTLLYNPSP